jgi:hypothetical protein
MSNRRRRILGLCVPPVLLALVDCVVTLVGQPATYWAGNYDSYNEISPTFARLLSIHPFAFLAGTAVLFCLYVAVIALLPEVLATVLSVALTMGHTFAITTWLWAYTDNLGYQLINGSVVASSLVLGLCLYGAFYVREEPRSSAWNRWDVLLLRLVGAGVLVGIVCYLYLIPH